MNTTHVTPTGIAVALAVAVALGLLFFGPHLFSPFTPVASQTATTTTVTTSTSTMDETAIPNPLPTELTSTDIVVGTGETATTGSVVTVDYTGMLPDGTVFDAASRHPDANGGFTFNLGGGQVIKGWDQGVVGMKVGGERRLIIPPALAYGNQAVGGVIPANATLIFDVKLLKVQ